jgi:hypothetical protein
VLSTLILAEQSNIQPYCKALMENIGTKVTVKKLAALPKVISPTFQKEPTLYIL